MEFKKKAILSFTVLLNIIISFILITEYVFAVEKPFPVLGLSFQDASADIDQVKISASSDAIDLPWRGVLVGGEHGTGDIHHDNIYVRINNGPIIYQTTVPARKENNLLPDAGLLWHFYTRNLTDISTYATSCWKNDTESDLSVPLELSIFYPSLGCTEQTVPVAVSGEDQIVQVGNFVTLDASVSFDPFVSDSLNLAYRWVCYSAPESNVVLSDDGQVAVTSFTPNAVGKYYFRLSVRDQFGLAQFNRSQVAYVRISVVDDPSDPALVDANAGRTKQSQVGEVVTLDGSLSVGPSEKTTYHWVHENPIDETETYNMASIIGQENCQGECYKSNYDADDDVDGSDLALLALNYGEINLPNNPVVQFNAGISGPHVFTLTVSDGEHEDSESIIVAVNHENAEILLTPPPVDSGCL